MSPRKPWLWSLILLVAGACGPKPGAGPVTDEPDKPPVWSGDRKVEVGSRNLNLRCIGSGGPTVVLDADWNQPGSAWAPVEPELAKLARVCSYDRPGLGKSDVDPVGPRSVQLLVYDLEKLLTQAEEKGPYVLVGDSLASYTARLFARQYPEEVAGLVLIRPAHMALEPELRELLDEKQQRWWSSPPEILEQIDFERSASIIAAPAAPPSVPTAIVSGSAKIPSAGFPGQPPEELATAAARIEERVREDLDATSASDPVTAVKAVVEAARGR